MDYLCVDEKKLVENLSYWQKLVKKNGAELNAVTKFCLSEPKYVDVLCRNGVRVISDSNMQNHMMLKDILPDDAVRCVIKTRVSDIKKYAEADFAAQKNMRFFLSDEQCLKEIRKIPEERRPQIVLIMECGDLKDGLYQSDIKRLASEYCDLPIIGVSANFACLSGKMPDMESLRILFETARYIQDVKKLEKPFVSVGGTVMHDLLESGQILSDKSVFVSEVRCGEGIFFGYNSSKGAEIPGLNKDVFQFRAEIIEVQEKIIPEQKNEGLNALGEHSVPRPAGKRRCAVLDFGVLVASSMEIIPKDADILMVGQTFDFTVVDVSQSKQHYHTGDYVFFYINYASASFMCMNRFVEKTVS